MCNLWLEVKWLQIAALNAMHHPKEIKVLSSIPNQNRSVSCFSSHDNHWHLLLVEHNSLPFHSNLAPLSMLNVTIVTTKLTKTLQYSLPGTEGTHDVAMAVRVTLTLTVVSIGLRNGMMRVELVAAGAVTVTGSCSSGNRPTPVARNSHTPSYKVQTNLQSMWDRG